MWIMLNDAFLSIVKPAGREDMLLVRARVPGDIKAVFPTARVAETRDRDYRFRALVGRDEVANALAARVMEVSYGNFKDSVREDDRHDVYLDVWTVMHRWQREVQANGRRRAKAKLGRIEHMHRDASDTDWFGDGFDAYGRR